MLYEPQEEEITGTLYEKIYPGPPEYTSTKDGDAPEKMTVVILKEPINVDLQNNDDELNEPEKGVREMQLVFTGIKPNAEQIKKEITLKGTLYHRRTAHHHRRVLMMVKNWSLEN